jgi:hypothetical protein
LNWKWAQRAGGPQYDRAKGVTVTGSGHIVVTGFHYGDVMFGANLNPGYGDGDIFVAALDKQGNWLWSQRAGTFDYDEGYDVDVLDGNLVVTGSIGAAEAAFAETTIASVGSDDIVVAQLGPDGEWSWVKRAGGRGRDESYSVTFSPSGSIYITGIYTATAQFGDFQLNATGAGQMLFVAKLDGSGQWLWVA